jgi:hypothetical protein
MVMPLVLTDRCLISAVETPETGDKGEDAGCFERTEEKRELIDLSCGLRLPAAGQSRRPTLLRRNGKGVARQLLGGN